MYVSLGGPMFLIVFGAILYWATDFELANVRHERRRADPADRRSGGAGLFDHQRNGQQKGSGARKPAAALLIAGRGREASLMPPREGRRQPGAATPSARTFREPPMRGLNESNRKWWVLIGTSGGLFVLMLDSTVVALALPSIQADLNASTDQLQWILNAYLLAIAATVVTAGRFGDIFGRRRVFLIGFGLFGLGSLLCAGAWNADVLIAGRVVMALGAASMLPLSLALVTYVFPADEQARAIGIWTAISSIALGIGPLGGGVLSDIDWRLIFVVNLPRRRDLDRHRAVPRPVRSGSRPPSRGSTGRACLP